MGLQQCLHFSDDITVVGDDITQAAIKNCTPSIKCLKKIDAKTIYDAEDLDLVMPMYKLLQYSSNYSNTTSSLWFYSKDKAINFHDNFADNVAFESY